MSDGKKVLVAISSRRVRDRLETMLLRSAVTIKRVEASEGPLAVSYRRVFDAIVIEFPPSGLDFGDFLDRLRLPPSASKRTPVVVLSRSLYRPIRQRWTDRHHEGLIACTTGRQLLKAVAEILDLGDRSLRSTAEVVTWLEGAHAAQKVERAALTKNISYTGMLLRTTPVPPVGSVLPLRVKLPRDPRPIHCVGEVVRHTSSQSESVTGLGMKFLGFYGDGRERLDGFVQAHAEPSRELESEASSPPSR
jgi:hypothetical protein